MAIRATSSSSYRRTSNIFASYAAQLQAAQAARVDADWRDGLISDDEYVKILESRRRMATTPLERQTLTNRIDDVKEDSQRKRIIFDIEQGSKDFIDLALFEEQLLSTMNPGSSRYIDQQNRFWNTRDQAASLARELIIHQEKQGIVDKSARVELERSLLDMYADQGTESLAYQKQLRNYQRAQLDYNQQQFQRQKALVDNRYQAEMTRARVSGNFGAFSRLVQEYDAELVRRHNENPEMFYDEAGQPNAAFYALESRRQSLSDSLISAQEAAISRAERQAAKQGISLKKAVTDSFTSSMDPLKKEQEYLSRGLISVDRLTPEQKAEALGAGRITDKSKTVISTQVVGPDGSTRTMRFVRAADAAQIESVQRNILIETRDVAYNATVAMAMLAANYGDVVDSFDEAVERLRGEADRAEESLRMMELTSVAQNPSTIDQVVEGGESFRRVNLEGENIESAAGEGKLATLSNGRRVLLSDDTPSAKVTEKYEGALGQAFPVGTEFRRVQGEIVMRKPGQPDFVAIDERTALALVSFQAGQNQLRRLGYPSEEMDALVATVGEMTPEEISSLQGEVGLTDMNAAIPEGQNQMVQRGPLREGRTINEIGQSIAQAREQERLRLEEEARVRRQRELEAERQMFGGEVTITSQAPVTPPASNQTLVSNANLAVRQPVTRPLQIVGTNTGPAPTVATKAPVTPLKTNPTITSQPLRIVGANPADAFYQRREIAPTGLGRLFNSTPFVYQFKMNPDKTFGIDFFRGDKPITHEQFTSGTGRSLSDIEAEMNKLLSQNNLRQTLGGR